MIKRLKNIVTLRGIELKDGKPSQVEHNVGWRFKDREALERRSRYEFPGFLLQEVVSRRQIFSMSEEYFFAHAEASEIFDYDPEFEAQVKEESSAIEENN